MAGTLNEFRIGGKMAAILPVSWKQNPALAI